MFIEKVTVYPEEKNCLRLCLWFYRAEHILFFLTLGIISYALFRMPEKGAALVYVLVLLAIWTGLTVRGLSKPGGVFERRAVIVRLDSTLLGFFFLVLMVLLALFALSY